MPSPEVASLLSFDEQDREVSFQDTDGSTLAALLSNSNPNLSEIFIPIRFVLVDTEGSTTSYEQILIIKRQEQIDDQTIEEVD